MDFNLAILRQGQWFFFITAESVIFQPALKGRVEWDEFNDAQETAEFLAMPVAGIC